MRNPELARLEFLAGKWRSTDRSHSGKGAPPATGHGLATYHWGIGDLWMLYVFKTELPGFGAYEVHGGLTYDQASSSYKAFAVNSMGLLMVYEGGWESDYTLVFSLVHPAIQPDTRVSYTQLPDREVRMTSERPTGSGGREVYFETHLKK